MCWWSEAGGGRADSDTACAVAMGATCACESCLESTGETASLGGVGGRAVVVDMFGVGWWVFCLLQARGAGFELEGWKA